jgi:putative redox protein
MKLITNTLWTGNMAFETQLWNHLIKLDASPENGGADTGPRPKALLMVSLAGCTGMDVVSILKKMRVSFSTFNIRVEGDVLDEHPKAYTAMKLIYEFTGTDLPFDNIRKAIKLSIDRYCGVHATLVKAVEMSYAIKLNDEIVAV